MRNLKKVLSLVLCVAVMLSVMVLGAGAAFSDQADIENTEAVDACSALNIIGGYEDGSFHPERNIKRSEITKMICVALNGGKDPNVGTNEVPTFNDVRGTADAWAEGYIEACVAQGIVSGVGGGRFAPAGNVTGAQLAKMLLVCLGYNSDNEGFTGNAWETNVNVRAAQKHLYDGLEKMDTSAAVTRDQAAQMVWNAMNAYEVEYKTNIITDENGNLVTQVVVQDKVVGSNNDKITLLYDKYEAYVNVGTLTSIDGSNLTISMSTADKADSDRPEYDSFSKLGADYSALMGQKVKVMFTKTSEVLGVYATSDNTTYTVNLKDIEKDGDKVKFDGASYGFDDGSKITVVKLDANKESVVTGQTMDAAAFDTTENKIATASVKFVDNDGDGKLNIAIITEYLAEEVTYVGSDRITAGTTYKMADENIASDIAQGDYAMISYNMYDECLDIAKAEVVTDTLNSSKDKDKYTQYEVGSTWYNITNDEANNVSVGDTVKAHIVAGVIVSIETDDGNGAIPTNVAVVVGKGDSTLTGDQVKLRFFDGTTKIVTLDSKGNVKTADDADIGQAYKVSGSDNNTRLDNLTSGNKYNGFYWNTKTDGKPLDIPAITADPSAGKIAGMTVADNAVIVLYDGNGASKTITGKQFKALDTAKDIASPANDKEANTAFTKSVNGLDRIMLASVKVNDVNVSGVSYDNYGYIVTSGAKKANGDVAFTMWNGSENVAVLWENGNESELVKGTLIAYASINDSKYVQDGEVIGTLEQIKNGDAPVNDQGFKADSNKGNDSKTISVGDNSLDVTADTKVLVLDTDASKDDEIGLEYTYGDKLAKAAENADGSYRTNVVYRVEDGKAASDGADLDLLVIDNTGAFDFDKPGKDDSNQGTIDNDIKGLITSLSPDGKTFTVAFTVPEGTQGLSVKYQAKVDGIITDSGTASTGGNPAITVNGTQAQFQITLKSAASSKDAVALTLEKLTYTKFGAGVSESVINDALKQESAAVTLAGDIPAGDIAVPKGASLTLDTGATIKDNTTIKNTDGTVTIQAVTVENGATLTIEGTIENNAQITAKVGATVIVNGVTYTGKGGILDLSATQVPGDSAPSVTLTFGADKSVAVTVANNVTVDVKTADWTFPMTITTTGGTVKVDSKTAASGTVEINPASATVNVRPNGPANDGTPGFNYAGAYEKYGVEFSNNNLTYTVTAAKLKATLESDQGTMKKLIGGETGNMYVGLQFMPVNNATKVQVVGYGDGSKDVTLNSVTPVGGLSGWDEEPSLLGYFNVGKIDGKTCTLAGNGTYNLTLTWMNDSDEVVAVTHPTITRVVK